VRPQLLEEVLTSMNERKRDSKRRGTHEHYAGYQRVEFPLAAAYPIVSSHVSGCVCCKLFAISPVGLIEMTQRIGLHHYAVEMNFEVYLDWHTVQHCTTILVEISIGTNMLVSVRGHL